MVNKLKLQCIRPGKEGEDVEVITLISREEGYFSDQDIDKKLKKAKGFKKCPKCKKEITRVNFEEVCEKKEDNCYNNTCPRKLSAPLFNKLFKLPHPIQFCGINGKL